VVVAAACLRAFPSTMTTPAGVALRVTEMLQNSVEIPAKKPRHMRSKTRLCTIQALDGRTLAAKRARELADGFEAELGGSVTPTMRLAIERAAALVALSEDAKARRLAGDTGVSLEDIVRTDNAAARAVKALGKPAAAIPAPPTPAEYLARRAAERAGKPSGDPA
jgi:hypothetical protein